MAEFMILYQYTDEDGLHRLALFSDSYEEAHAKTVCIVFYIGAQVKIYKLNKQNDNYDFLEKWAPEKHQTRKEINQ